MTNSQEKGKRGEREAAAALQEHLGVSARRGRQYCGTPESPDVVADIPGVYFEVKRCERLRLYRAVDAAVGDSQGKVPVVLHRANRREWLAIVRLSDLRRLAEIIVKELKDGDTGRSGTGGVHAQVQGCSGVRDLSVFQAHTSTNEGQ